MAVDNHQIHAEHGGDIMGSTLKAIGSDLLAIENWGTFYPTLCGTLTAIFLLIVAAGSIWFPGWRSGGCFL